MAYVSYADHAKLNHHVREIKLLLEESGELRQVALQYASRQLTALLLGHRVRRRWTLGPERTLRVLDYLTRVSFDDRVTTAEVNFLRDCDARLSPQFYQRFVITVEDLVGVLLHERNHPLIVGLLYPPLAVCYDSALPHNAIDDTLDNAIVRSLCFTDVFERYYLGAPDGITPPETGEFGEWSPPAEFKFPRWYWPLLTYRNDLCVTTINHLVDSLPVTDEKQIKALRDLAAVHWGNYEPFRHRLTRHLAQRQHTDQKHPLFVRLREMLQAAQRTATPTGLTTKEWAEWRLHAAQYTPVDALRALRRGFAVVAEQRDRQRQRYHVAAAPTDATSNDTGLTDDFLKGSTATPLIGDTPSTNAGLAKVSGVLQQLPEWTDDDSNLVKLARDALAELRDYAPSFTVDSEHLLPFDRYQQVLVNATAQHLNEQSYTSELWDSATQPYLPPRLSRRDLLTLSRGAEPLDYSTRTAPVSPPPPYHFIADVSGSMTRYLPLLPAFVRATREQLSTEALVFSGEQHLVPLDDLLRAVQTNQQTLFLPVWDLILSHGWSRVVVLTDDETAEKRVTQEATYLALQDAVVTQKLVLCLLRVGDYRGPWTELLQRKVDDKPLGPPHLLVVLSPTAIPTAA